MVFKVFVLYYLRLFRNNFFFGFKLSNRHFSRNRCPPMPCPSMGCCKFWMILNVLIYYSVCVILSIEWTHFNFFFNRFQLFVFCVAVVRTKIFLVRAFEEMLKSLFVANSRTQLSAFITNKVEASPDRFLMRSQNFG